MSSYGIFETVVGYVNIILMACAIGFILSWPRHRSKTLLSTAMMLLFVFMVYLAATNLILSFGSMPWNITTQSIGIIIIISNMLGYVLLLAFAIYSKRQLFFDQGEMADTTHSKQVRSVVDESERLLPTEQYLFYMVVLMIPFVNLVTGLWWAFTSKGNRNRKNFARAYLILTVVLSIIFFLIMLAIASHRARRGI